ncbi:M61 family metallopeptidase [Sphingomonas daechungensis]|uniref:M61 family metallopeptidase n=1 Tax=Sphingomonas daechungensis TaxID=1176646 RepID=UPI0037834758
MLRLAVAAFALAFSSAAAATVNYAIDLTSPEHHSGKVRIVFPAGAAGTLDVKMPAWRTGRYQILNLANGVSEFAAKDERGRALPWQKVDKSTWRIQRAGTGPVTVEYDVYANELGLRSRHIDDSHAYLDASAVFMYSDANRADDVAVSLKVPTGWRSFSGLQSAGANRFTGANWDILVDSPIETGVNRSFAFKEGGRDYEVVFWGEGNYDATQTVADLKKIVAQAPSIWSSYPFQRYVWMIHATDGVGGATEHRNSTVIQIPRNSFQPREKYLRFLSTAAHEFIHTWNVKAYRAGAMVPYRYQEENYTDLLWLEEGSTDYFADQFLLRAGIMKPDEYFAALADAVEHYKRTPGAAQQSVASTSFDEWIAPSGDRATNAWSDIYAEGSMVSWMLDIALLQESGGKLSYRNVHDVLYRRYPSEQGKGFNAADVKAILAELTGHSWEAWWAQNVDAPAPVDFDRLLGSVGLRISYEDGDKTVPSKPWAGWKADQAEGGMKLTVVERGSPAWDAGFAPDDIVTAFDGGRVTKDRFEDALTERKAGDTVTVSYFRRDQLMQKTLKLGSIPKNKAKVVKVARATPAQKALYQRWLLTPYPAD